MNEKFRSLKIIILSILLSAAVTLTSCGLMAYPDDSEVYKGQFRMVSSMGIAQAQLSEHELELYDILNTALRDGADVISAGLEDYGDNTIVKVYTYVLTDHPEYFWVRDGYTLKTETGIFTKKKTLVPIYIIDKSKIPEYKARVEEVRGKIMTAVGSLQTDYEKLLYIHDYIVSTTRYDTVAYTDIDSKTPAAATLESTTLYGALVNRLALCGGYAKAFQYLAEAAGIRCTCVTGDKKDGEAHAWNLVVLDGEYYYVDVTWDDPVFTGHESEDDGSVYYNYFCISDEDLLKTHIPDDTLSLPKCTAEKYNYFVYHHAYLETYSYDAAAAVIQRAAGEGRDKAYIRFRDERGMEAAIRELFEERKIFSVLLDAGISAENTFYTKDTEKYIVTVSF